MNQLWHGITNLPKALLNELTRQADTLNHLGASLFGAIGALFTGFGRPKKTDLNVGEGDAVSSSGRKKRGEVRNPLARHGLLYDIIAMIMGYRSQLDNASEVDPHEKGRKNKNIAQYVMCNVTVLAEAIDDTKATLKARFKIEDKIKEAGIKGIDALRERGIEDVREAQLEDLIDVFIDLRLEEYRKKGIWKDGDAEKPRISPLVLFAVLVDLDLVQGVEWDEVTRRWYYKKDGKPAVLYSTEAYLNLYQGSDGKYIKGKGGKWYHEFDHNPNWTADKTKSMFMEKFNLDEELRDGSIVIVGTNMWREIPLDTTLGDGASKERKYRKMGHYIKIESIDNTGITYDDPYGWYSDPSKPYTYNLSPGRSKFEQEEWWFSTGGNDRRMSWEDAARYETGKVIILIRPSKSFEGNYREGWEMLEDRNINVDFTGLLEYAD